MVKHEPEPHTELPDLIADVARTPTGLRSDGKDPHTSDQGLSGGR